MQVLSIILAILAFGVLVIVHEFGHFITAKRGGVQVNEFWIGMGPTLLKHEHKGTLYCLKLLPFGGACVMEGEDGESENEHAFGKAKLPRRMLIVCAGALMNFLVGFLIVLAVMRPNGPNGGYIVSTISEVNPASTAAADGGLEAGDEILKIDGYHILVRTDFDTALARTIAVYEVLWMGEKFIKSKGIIWPLFYTAVFYLIFNGLLTLLFGWIEKKMDYFK